jgi:DNA-binding transcriptional LysR family regulator
MIDEVQPCGSYTAAAEALGLQSSKLSRRVGALERELSRRSTRQYPGGSMP